MSTFKEITENTLTNNGEAISGRLLYTQLGGNESKPVYFGLKDGADSWTENLSTIGTSAFYLTSNVSGCTAQVKDSTTSPTNGDANTAREIFLNIPSTTTSRTIQFSYNGITVLTVNQTIEYNRFCHIIDVSFIDNLPDHDFLITLTSKEIALTQNLLSYPTIAISRGVKDLLLYMSNDNYSIITGYTDDDFNRLMSEYNLTYRRGKEYSTNMYGEYKLICGNRSIYDDNDTIVDVNSLFIDINDEYPYTIYIYYRVTDNDNNIKLLGYASSSNKGVYTYFE